MDLNKLRTQVFEKTGIRIDTGDPIFALVALNEAVLAECIAQHVSGLENATAQLAEHTGQLLAAGERVKSLLIQMGATVQESEGQLKPPIVENVSHNTSNKQAELPWRSIAAAVGIALLSAAFVLIGQSIIHGNQSAPKPTAAASVLTPVTPKLTQEQVVLIQNGEKYAKMWPKLDAKTQARIQALSQ